MLIQIQPIPVIFLKHGVIADHIMLTPLLFQPGHWHILNRSPASLQFTSIMTVSRECVCVAASTVSTFPVNFPRLAGDHTRLSFFSPELGCHLGFQNVCHYHSHTF